MSQRFGSNMEEKNVLAIATLLDPRFKKLPFSSESSVEKMSRQIISDATTLSSQLEETVDQSTSQAQAVSTTGIWEFFDLQAAQSTSRRALGISAMTELKQYFKIPVIKREENPLLWWRQNGHFFPALQNVARVYLSTVATSVPSERLFSKAGELVSTKRNRIKPKHVSMFLFFEQVLSYY